MLPSIAGQLVAPPAELLGIGDERCVEALSGERQGIGLRPQSPSNLSLSSIVRLQPFIET